MMKQILLALLLAVLLCAPVSAALYPEESSSQEDILALPAFEEVTPVLSKAAAGSGRLINLDLDAFRFLGSTLYPGGTFNYSFRYTQPRSVTYRFNPERSSGSIRLDSKTGTFTILTPGSIVIEVWANGVYDFECTLQPIQAEMPNLALVKLNQGVNLLELYQNKLLEGADYSILAQEVVRLTNLERTAQGLPALRVDTALSNAAMIRAKECATDFSHTRPNGDRAVIWARDSTPGAKYACENIAMGQYSPSQVNREWMASQGHRDNILSAKTARIGVGFYEGEDGIMYWTQLFTD